MLFIFNINFLCAYFAECPAQLKYKTGIVNFKNIVYNKLIKRYRYLIQELFEVLV